MDFISSMEISSSALSAQRSRLNIISQNLANAETTRTPEGGPYQRRITVMAAVPFVSHLTKAIDSPPDPPGKDPRRGVYLEGVYRDPAPFRKVYDPSHPDAGDDGYVEYPNVDVVTEMTNLIEATRSYEANVTAIGATKAMAIKALEIGK